MFRWIGWATAAVSLFTAFVAIAAVLHVRSAIDGGALGYPALGCVEKRDLEKVRNGLEDDTARSWLRNAVYNYHVGENRSPGLGLRGALAEFGIRIWMSESDRIETASTSMSQMPVCHGSSAR